MLNVIDLIVAAFALYFLLKHAGGLTKTIRNVVVVLLIILLIGVGVRLLLNTAFVSGEARNTLESSYFVKAALAAISVVYPSISNEAPKVDSFIKDNIIVNDKGKPADRSEEIDLDHPEKYLPKYQLKYKSAQ